MIRFFFLFLIVGFGLFVGTQYANQQGYVLISIANKTLEMSFTTFVIFVGVFFVALFGAELIVKKALRMGADTWNWFSIRKLKRSRRMTNEGIIKLIEGDWKTAEKRVTRWANHHDMPLLCYLVAAEAAQARGDTQKATEYLERAAKQDNAKLAVGLTQGKLLIDQEKYQQALVHLTELKISYPENPRLLTMLKSLYVELEQWEALSKLVLVLDKQKLVTPEELEKLRVTAQQGMLRTIAQDKGRDALIQYWSEMGRKERKSQSLTEFYAQLLVELGANAEALSVIKELLKRHPQSSAYTQLPRLAEENHADAIKVLNKELVKDGNNAEAHSALARLLMQQEKWSDAQQHLEKALSLRSNVDDYRELAQVLEAQNMPKAAQEVSKKALMLVSPNNA